MMLAIDKDGTCDFRITIACGMSFQRAGATGLPKSLLFLCLWCMPIALGAQWSKALKVYTLCLKGL